MAAERNPFPHYVRLSWLGPWRLTGAGWERRAAPFPRAGFPMPDALPDAPITVRVPIDNGSLEASTACPQVDS